MEYGSGWLPPMIMRQPEPVQDLFETLLYCTEIERPDWADPASPDYFKADLAALQGARKYPREAHGYDILMETLTADPALDVEEHLLAKQKQILEMAYRAKELCDEHRAQEEAEEDEEEEEE